MFVGHRKVEKAWAANAENLITGFETSMNYAQDANPVRKIRKNGEASSDPVKYEEFNRLRRRETLVFNDDVERAQMNSRIRAAKEDRR
jgi:hypothetical protein